MYARSASVKDEGEPDEDSSATAESTRWFHVSDCPPPGVAVSLPAERLRERLQRLQKMGMRTAESYMSWVLLQSPCVIAQQVDAPTDDVDAIFRHVSAAVVQQSGSLLSPMSVGNLLAHRYRKVILTGHSCLDKALMGGIGCECVTEFTGPMGAGKTALALHMALHTASYAKGDARKARTLWITTDASAFPATAAAAVLQWHIETRRTENTWVEDTKDALCDVAVMVQSTLSELLENLPGLSQWYFKRQKNVRLVVIDGLSTLVRRSFPGVEKEMLERHEAISNLMNLLKGIAHEFCAAVVVTTHSGAELGHAFVHAVNTRLRITWCQLRRRGAAEARETLKPVVHMLEVEKSPVSAVCRFECEFDSLRLIRVRPLGRDDEAEFLEDVVISGIDPFGHVVVPTFVYC